MTSNYNDLTVEIEKIETTYHVRLHTIKYEEYPYDTFLLIRLPGLRAMVYRMESDDFLIWGGEIPYDARPAEFLFPLIDDVCKDKLTRVNPRTEHYTGYLEDDEEEEEKWWSPLQR